MGLFFAGEALADFDYGYVHTAYLSGVATANQILACMGFDPMITDDSECPTELPFDDDAMSECKERDRSFGEICVAVDPFEYYIWRSFGIDRLTLLQQKTSKPDNEL